MSDTLTAPSAPAEEPEAAGPGRRRIAPFIALGLAVVIGALFVVLAGSGPADTDSIDSSLIGTPAPVAKSTTLQGQTFDLSRRKGSWVVLNFFDPTCGPCVSEHPQLVAFQQQQQTIADGAELYTIMNDTSDGAVSQFFTDNGGTWPVVRDPDGSIYVAFGVAQVPETWIIDPDGIIQRRLAGPITADGLGTLLQQLRESRA
ncbi:MAG: ccmG [Ilumatobacteraceae bacterium]|nr:ccmG [Ilumatobacteraceae bacterium]